MTRPGANDRLRPRLRVRDVADLTQSSERTVRRWIANGTLPSSKVGGVVLINPADLERLLGVSDEDFADDDESEEDDGTDCSEINALSDCRASITQVIVPYTVC